MQRLLISPHAVLLLSLLCGLLLSACMIRSEEDFLKSDPILPCGNPSTELVDEFGRLGGYSLLRYPQQGASSQEKRYRALNADNNCIFEFLHSWNVPTLPVDQDKPHVRNPVGLAGLISTSELTTVDIGLPIEVPLILDKETSEEYLRPVLEALLSDGCEPVDCWAGLEEWTASNVLYITSNRKSGGASLRATIVIIENNAILVSEKVRH